MYKKFIHLKFSQSAIKLFLIAVVVLFSGCFGVKNNYGNAGMSLYETFFVGDDGSQYFIKPLTFKDENKNRVILDITFRYKDRIKDSASLNMSFLNTEIYRNIDSLKISNDSVSVEFKSFKYLFAERNQKEFISRFSTKGPLANIAKLFEKNNWSLTVYAQKKQSIYTTPNMTKRKIDKLKYGIFMLF